MSDDPANWTPAECERNGVFDGRVCCEDCELLIDLGDEVDCKDGLVLCAECAMVLANHSSGRGAA